MDMMNEKKKPVYPALDEGTYAEDVERGFVEAEKKAAEIERQAKRDRDMALIGDMAHLVSQGAAMHGGAWKIGQTQNEGAKGNERLRVLREKNAAQTAAFAKERAALMETKRKEQNAQKLAKYNAELEAYKREQAQANTLARLEEQERHNRAMEQIQTDREDRLEKQGGSGGGSGVNRDVFLINDDGSRTEFKHADDANNVLAAYWEMMRRDPDSAVMKESYVYEYRGGKYVPAINDDGTKKTTFVVNEYPSTKDALNAIAKHNAAKTKATVPAKKANPMGNGKKTNPMN